MGAKNTDPKRKTSNQKVFPSFLPKTTLNDKIRGVSVDTALFEKKNNQRRARKDVHKRYKYTHQKQLLLHQRCPLLFPLPRGECFVPRFFRKENINSIVSSSHKDWMDCTSRRKSTRERGKNRSREGSLFFPPFYDRSCE